MYSLVPRHLYWRRSTACVRPRPPPRRPASRGRPLPLQPMLWISTAPGPRLRRRSQKRAISLNYSKSDVGWQQPGSVGAAARMVTIMALLHPSGIEGLIFGSWATLSGERLSCVGPAEGPGHGGVEISDELLDPGLQHLLAGEVAAADKLSYQNGKPDFDLIEP